jgi:hypothetical protein
MAMIIGLMLFWAIQQAITAVEHQGHGVIGATLWVWFAGTIWFAGIRAAHTPVIGGTLP